ncbi:flavin-containing monooxygenase 5-like [Ornithodoros turicata]|uniref:flavin-containing monooxygenase 5-like n=1 Tax=Ornithodoros turicata TaxID=34597 RepID=UPI0031399C81
MAGDGRPLVAVVGAGSSGLPSIKACIEEGLDVICFEKTDHLGGLWQYTEEAAPGVGGVARNTVLNSSKEMSAYSDFPPPADFPNFMHHSALLKYLRLYSDQYGLERYIRFNHQVTSVLPCVDHSATGRWLVQGNDLKSGLPFVALVNAVVVSSGHNAQPKWPSFPGTRDFKGRVLHAHSYRKAAPFEDRAVLVVGLGNSAGDIATELSYVCSQVHLSTRRGAWVMPRIGRFGRPTDLSLNTRALDTARRVLPESAACHLFERRLNSAFDHSLYNLRPEHRALNQQPFVSDVLPSRILSGTIRVHANVSRFNTDSVTFEDGEQVPIDDVIFATGYWKHFDFLPAEVAKCIREDRVDLYKLIFPTRLEHPTLAFVGLIDPIGAFWSVAEMQARFAVAVFTGKLSVPDTRSMLVEISQRTRRIGVKSDRYATQVRWIEYMDDLASSIGVRPNLARMAVKDPTLFLQCFTGPCLPYQFRLEGPHRWEGAREAIMTYEERVASALSPQTAANTHIRRAMSNAFDFIGSCGLMLILSYLISLAV